jgi:Flp pilus assembly protein TadG
MTLFLDRRGVAALEFGVIALVVIALLLPITDLVVAALQYMSAYQAMRDLGAYAQYHAPPDVTNTSGWTLPATTAQVIATTVLCGNTATACSAGNTNSPKWFRFSTDIVVAPMFPAVVPGLAGTYTLSYSERFQ